MHADFLKNVNSLEGITKEELEFEEEVLKRYEHLLK